MPKSGDLVVGVLFILCGLIFLLTRTSYEASLAKALQAGHLTPAQAQAKQKGRGWVGVGSLIVGACLEISHFLLAP